MKEMLPSVETRLKLSKFIGSLATRESQIVAEWAVLLLEALQIAEENQEASEFLRNFLEDHETRKKIKAINESVPDEISSLVSLTVKKIMEE